MISSDASLFVSRKNEFYFLSSSAAEIAWHESRKEWVGDQSNKPQRMAKEPVIR